MDRDIKAMAYQSAKKETRGTHTTLAWGGPILCTVPFLLVARVDRVCCQGLVVI